MNLKALLSFYTWKSILFNQKRIIHLIGLGLPDYFDIIKNPMDLGSVKKNLNGNKYKFIEDCLGDIQLIWDNCKMYNAEGSVSICDSYH